MSNRDNSQSRRGFIIIPTRRYICSWKVTITNTDTSQVWDITNYVINLNINWQCSRIAEASLDIVNDSGRWLGIWNGGEVLDIYGEYIDDPNPTNKLFSGRLDSIFFNLDQNGYTCYLESRQKPELVDIKVVEQFDNALVTDAIKLIVDNYYNGIVTYATLPVSTERFTGSFRHVSGITAMSEMANKVGMDLYIDVNGEIKLFTKETVNNDNENIDYQTNLVSFPKYGRDRKKEYNRIIVYGKENDNIVLLKTEEDLVSQADTWRKDEVITDNSLTTMTDIQNFADAQLVNKATVYNEGSVNTLGMTLIKPGDNIVIAVPNCGASGYHNIRTISHNLSESGFLTTLSIKYKQPTLNEMFKERMNAEERLKPYNNLNNMSDSYTIYFNESPSVVTLVNTEIFVGSDKNYLKLTDGMTDGSFITSTLDSDGNIVQCELRIKSNYPNQELCTFNVSNNGGASWEPITPGTLHTFSSSGDQLKLMGDIIGDSTHNPIFEAICIMYKRA